MVDLTPHPNMCERCRTMRARLRHRKQVGGLVEEKWLCYECAAAILDGCEDLQGQGENHD